MGTFVLALTLGILARAWLSPRIKLPYTSVVLMLGAQCCVCLASIRCYPHTCRCWPMLNQRLDGPLTLIFK